jgi:hypothetical protein
VGRPAFDGPGLEKLGHADFSSFSQTVFGAEPRRIAAFFIVRVCWVIIGKLSFGIKLGWLRVVAYRPWGGKRDKNDAQVIVGIKSALRLRM